MDTFTNRIQPPGSLPPAAPLVKQRSSWHGLSS